MNIVLASGSPRRKQIFHQLFSSFKIIIPECTEINPRNYFPKQAEFICSCNANRKANYVYSHGFFQNTLLVGCDTVVATKDKILGKPHSRSEALAMLFALSGEEHWVVTSGIIVWVENGYVKNRTHFTDSTCLRFSNLTRHRCLEYIDTFHPYDKAGSYGIQELPDGFLQSTKGSIWNVVGFPIEVFSTIVLRKWGIFCNEVEYENSFAYGRQRRLS